MAKKLNIIATIKDGVAIALVNYLSLVLTAALYLITIWVPYINVGTTIAMCSLPAEMAKGHILNPLFIFDAKYRRNMGEFFILMALMMGAIWVGFLFGIIPGIVISVAWSFATVLFVDKDMSALDSLRESNRLTYGNKWRIFGAEFLIVLCLQIVVGIVQLIFNIGDISWLQAIGTILVLVIVVFAVPAIYGVEASIYRQLTTDKFLEETVAPEAPAPAPVAEPEAPKAPAKKAPVKKAPAKKAPAKAKKSE